MKKPVLIVALVLTVLMIAGACAPAATPDPSPTSAAPQTTSDAGAATEEPEKTYKMALVVKNLTNPYFVTLADGAQKAADELGIELDIQATNADTEIDAQIQILDTLITQNLDAILVIPLNNTAVVPWVKRANEANIPVINVDTAIDEKAMEEQGASIVSKLTTDNMAAGEEGARAIIKALDGKGKVAMIEGTAGATTAEDRKTGFYNVMDSAEGEGIEVVISQDGKYNRNEGYTIMTSILAAHPDIDAVFAANDEMALGAIAAIKDADLTGEIHVVGVNFAEEMQTAMKEGSALGSVNQDPAWLGYKGVYVALDHLEGKDVEYTYMSESKMMYKEDVK
ncbi:MAG: sugar ABC transporter substrate-binding protein [Christensenellales bacterium]|jgi:ribose transport system substrate-binding protein